MMDFFTLKHNASQTKNIRKATHSFVPPTSDFSATTSLKIQWYLRELELPENWPGYELFKLISCIILFH